MKTIFIFFFVVILLVCFYSIYINYQLSNRLELLYNAVETMKEDIILNKLQNNNYELRMLKDENYLMEIYTEIFPLKRSANYKK
jgi:hypothetical protein